ncbi:MAG: hypothetical protein OEV49_00080 [candidate division Zixibacteria bacterium]|nr:hypothetical protein [candidate division Zixibacteria bacterium]MDH3937236.1 hypothetical protein [candidate division Zixibacteria bacterium]MDH4033365.1 hypothetical protein [candidate division Zixibacteria bacterium]
MNGCIDKEVGKLLHDYEMNWLTEENQERFELHLMDCDFCTQEVTQLESTARLLTDDDTVKAAVRRSVSEKERETTLRQRLVQLLWPKTNLLMRPALVYLLVVLLLPLAYHGILRDRPVRPQIAPVHNVQLVSTRGATTTIRPQPGMDMVLTFGFDGAVPGDRYEVRVQSEQLGLVYENTRLSFDERQTAHLRLPNSLLNAGEYTVTIRNPKDVSALGTDTLMFIIEF